jgi:hypothetical protein
MFNLLETTKRALFKLMPLALLYLANNELLLRLSRRISRWEASPWPGRSPRNHSAATGAPSSAAGSPSAAGSSSAPGSSSAAGPAPSPASSSRATPKKKHRKK